VSRGGEAAHVDADLGDDDLGGAPTHPGNGDQPPQLLTERADHPVHLEVEALDGGRELVDVVQVHPQHQRVMGAEAPLQRPAQLRDLGSHPGACQLGEGVGVADAGDERFEHLPGRHPEDVGDHRVQLDPGVLEQLLDPLGLPGAFLDQLLAVAGQVAQLGDHRWRHEAGPQ
jgi:hypothetical protein